MRSRPNNPPPSPRGEGQRHPALRALSRFDPGWLYVVAGALIIAMAHLVPAWQDLQQEHANRVQAEAYLDASAARVRSYANYLQSLESKDPALTISLAMTQLREAPEGLEPLVSPSTGLIHAGAAPEQFDADVFASLETVHTLPQEHELPQSMLTRLTANTSTKAWMTVLGILAIFWGLMPPTAVRLSTQAEA